MGGKDWRFARDPRQHDPVPQLQESRQEEVVTGDFPGPRQHHPAPKLQEGRQEEIMMHETRTGHFLETPRSTILVQSYKKGGNRRL